MRIAGTISDVLNAYDDVAFEIYVSGCYRACPGCHSCDLQSFDVGKRLDAEAFRKLVDDIEENSDFTGIISILGGDLLCQNEDEARRFVGLLEYFFPNKKLWLFTGAEPDELPYWAKKSFDVIKCGRFDQELYIPGAFPASTNQKVLRKGVDY